MFKVTSFRAPWIGLAMVLGLASAANGSPAGGAASTKPAIHGLVTMGRMQFLRNQGLPDNSLKEANTHPGVYAGAVILATWAQLQPVRDGALNTRAIDQGLEAVRAYNAKHPDHPLRAKLRIFAGENAPEWAKEIGGRPLTLVKKRGNPFTVGRFWSIPYRQAWRRLQDGLAARYDQDPLVEEVAVSSCSVYTAEPFSVPLRQEDIPVLHAAGYTDSADISCLNGILDDYSAWRRVALDLTVHAFRASDSGAARNDMNTTIAIMRKWRSSLGSRGVIANHGLKSPPKDKNIGLLNAIKALGPPIEFQTVGPTVAWDDTFRLFRELGGTEFEIWETRDAGGLAPVTGPQLQTWSASLK